MAFGSFKNLSRGTDSDKVLRDKAFDIAKNTKWDGYQRGIASIACKIIDKTSAASTENETRINYDLVFENKQLAEELNKPIIKTIEKSNVYLSFIDKILNADLEDMQLITKFNKAIRLICLGCSFKKSKRYYHY